MVDTLADSLISIKNNEMLGKSECCVKPASKIAGAILKIMQREGYVGNFEYLDDGKAGVYKIQLLGKINNCRVIKPRYNVKADGFEKWEKRYLPARAMGILIVSTPQGLLTHTEAKMAGTGGKLLAFVY
jgi:small subunit ribosomal protein S8